MLAHNAHRWVESYLLEAEDYRAPEAVVLAAGARQGFSERTLRRACRRLAGQFDSSCWQLHPARVAALKPRQIEFGISATWSFEPRFLMSHAELSDAA